MTVVGQNADGTWLQIEHQNRPGWIFAALTDIAAEGIVELPAEALPETAVVGPTPEPTVAPTPGGPHLRSLTALSQPQPGRSSTLCRGSGTDYLTAGQVRAGCLTQRADRTFGNAFWMFVMRCQGRGHRRSP